jgi:hypothetical protein
MKSEREEGAMGMERALCSGRPPHTHSLREPHVVQNGIQSRCNVGTNTAININATDNTATKTAASESSKPKGRQRIGTTRHQEKERISNARYVQGDHQCVHEATWPPLL